MEMPIANPIWNSLPPKKCLMKKGKKKETNRAEKAVFAKSYIAQETTFLFHSRFLDFILKPVFLLYYFGNGFHQFLGQ